MVLPRTEIASTEEMGFVATSKEDLALSASIGHVRPSYLVPCSRRDSRCSS